MLFVRGYGKQKSPGCVLRHIKRSQQDEKTKGAINPKGIKGEWIPDRGVTFHRKEGCVFP